MSNFLSTVGRSVQYVNRQGDIKAAIITNVYNGIVDLAVFDDGPEFVRKQTGVAQFVDTFEDRKRGQPNTYRLTWPGR